jgi:hypothetical protein
MILRILSRSLLMNSSIIGLIGSSELSRRVLEYGTANSTPFFLIVTNLETYINLLQRRELIGDIDSCYSILNLKLLNFIRRAKGDGWVSRTDLIRSEQFDDLTITNLDFELQLLLNSGKIDITAQGDNYRAYT